MENDIKNDKELYSYFVQRNATLCNENFSYLQEHKEVRLLLNDYLSSLLLHKPDDIFKYTKDYFQFLCEKPNVENLLLIVGPKCSGRTEFVDKIIEDFPSVFEYPLIYTTDKENFKESDRHSTIDKKTYHKMTKENELLEFHSISEDIFGISKNDVKRIASEGKICIVEIDIHTAKKIYKSGFHAHYVAIFPSSVELLRDRVKNEIRANTEQINQILDNANKEIKEIEKASYFSYRIINNDFYSGYEDFRNAVLCIFPFLKTNYEENLSLHNVI